MNTHAGIAAASLTCSDRSKMRISSRLVSSVKVQTLPVQSLFFLPIALDERQHRRPDLAVAAAMAALAPIATKPQHSQYPYLF